MSEILSGISKNNQVFMSTHSASLVQNFQKKSIYYTEIKEEKSGPISQYSLLDSIDQLRSSLGFNSYPFHKKNNVVIVEGPGDIKKYPKLFKKLGINCDDTAFIQLGGVANVKFAIDLQFIQFSDLRNKFFIIVDSDGRTEEESRKYFKGVFETNSGLSGANLKQLMSKRFYSTEKSTMIETFTFFEENMSLKGIELEDKLLSYLENNKEGIDVSLNLKIQQNKINEEKKNDVVKTLYEGSLEDKISILKEIVLTKKLYNKFINEVCFCKTIAEIENENLIKYIPKLTQKIELFFD